MSFAAFMKNPLAYVKTHRVFVANSDLAEGSVTPQAPVGILGGGMSVEFVVHAAHPISMMITGNTQKQRAKNIFERAARRIGVGSWARRDYGVCTSTGDVGFRYLPYRPNSVTYMALDGNARFCLTGPLTGCTVGAGSDGAGNVWFFHSNRNDLGAVAAARIPKRLMLNAVAANQGIAHADIALCEYGPNLQYDGLGFVFGKRQTNGEWRFYAHATGVGNATATNHFGTV
ncbi:hypothetical protein H8D79_00060 [PVC group bacterium]|nr:hypothetical protein [PVC group bacterium]